MMLTHKLFAGIATHFHKLIVAVLNNTLAVGSGYKTVVGREYVLALSDGLITSHSLRYLHQTLSQRDTNCSLLSGITISLEHNSQICILK